MAEVIHLRTPTGGKSSIAVDTRDGGIQLRFVRELGDGDVRSELLIRLTVDQAKSVGRALLDAGGVPHG